MIPFYKPYTTGMELSYIEDLIHNSGILSQGPYTEKVEDELNNILQVEDCIVVSSCTHAMEMSFLLINLQHGDEVLLPSYSFTSCATAVLQAGGIPVLVDCDRRTLQMDLQDLEKKITHHSKAILIVHYGGLCCDMNQLMSLAKAHQLFVVEDAAQAFGSVHKEMSLGTIGDFGCFSFHGTKNVGCGEGGGLCINNPKFRHRARILRDKGTNRQDFLNGVTKLYEWVDRGSSYVPGELSMAYLYAQLQEYRHIQSMRYHIFKAYENILMKYATRDIVSYSVTQKDTVSNAHLFYIQWRTVKLAREFKDYMNACGIQTATHFVSLHESKMAKTQGYTPEDCPNAMELGERVVRLPLYPDLSQADVDYICARLKQYISVSQEGVGYGA